MADKRTPQLSRELITTTALELVGRDGLPALSMRRLAQELDVWPMSVYRHFRDKEDLLDAVAAAGAEGVDVPAVTGGWRKQLPTLAAEARALLVRQPVDLRRRTLLSPAVLRLTDAALRALREGGMPSAAAATGWRAVLAYVIGSIELEAATQGARDTQAALLAAPEALAGGDAAFTEGLERVLDGIAASAP